MIDEKKSLEIQVVEIRKDYEYLSEKHEDFKNEYKQTCKDVIRSVDKLKEDIVDLFHLIENIKKDLENIHREEETRQTRCEKHTTELRKLTDINKESLTKRLIDDLSTSKFLKVIWKLMVILVVAYLSTKGVLSMDLGWLKLW